MQFIRSRVRLCVTGLITALAVAVPMAAQADAATSTVRLHAATNTSESLAGSSVTTTVFLVPTNVNSSSQKWIKTDVGGGFATYKNAASGRCLAHIVGAPFPFTSICDAANTSQHWTRGFIGDQRLENRRSLQALTRTSAGKLEMRFLTGLAGQKWHEHPA